ncbi:hypothetical protein HCH54_000549 [Aspergillus fumigatus]
MYSWLINYVVGSFVSSAINCHLPSFCQEPSHQSLETIPRHQPPDAISMQISKYKYVHWTRPDVHNPVNIKRRKFQRYPLPLYLVLIKSNSIPSSVDSQT